MKSKTKKTKKVAARKVVTRVTEGSMFWNYIMPLSVAIILVSAVMMAQ